MLDENTNVPKPRLFLTDWFLFAHPMGGIKLDNVRRLIYEFHPPWYLLYVHNGTTFEKMILDRVLELGLYVYDEYDLSSLVVFSDQCQIVFNALRIVDVAFVPRVRNLPVNFLLKSPKDDKQALEIVCHFCSSAEPFNQENYNRLLNTL